ncbi:hypothetical protein IAU60_005003 [Kwoniella sp. DSM 27419]
MSTYTPPLAPVMSRDNSAEDIDIGPSTHATFAQGGHSRVPSSENPADVVASLSRSFEAGPSRYLSANSMTEPSSRTGRRASKSVSGAGSRPQLVITPAAKRTQSYYTPQVGPSVHNLPVPPASPGPEGGPHTLKRLRSTPTLVRRYNPREDEIPEDDNGQAAEGERDPSQPTGPVKSKAVESRARSTSTSVVVPQAMGLTENSTYTLPSSSSSAGPSRHAYSPPPAGIPSHPTKDPITPSHEMPYVDLVKPDAPTSLLTSAYNVGESSVRRFVDWVKPRRHRYDKMAYRRGSEDNSEKGLNGSEEELSDSRGSDESQRGPGRYWGLSDAGSAETSSGYFSLPPSPPEESDKYPEFGAALYAKTGSQGGSGPGRMSLPTPALSTRSLSRGGSGRARGRNKLRKVFRRSRAGEEEDGRGWLSAILDIWAGYKGGKTAEVLKELGWTVGILVATFFVTAGIVLWLIQGMPITTLKHVPKSTTDLQLLSAEIRAYMASSDAGWWHTVGVLFLVGCWKHAWSVPGAVVLNILVGSLLDPMPALALLTLITASGSLGAYMLSRPLAPLIAVLFPKPLALVRAALAPDSVPTPVSATSSTHPDTVTPIQASSDPSAPPIGGPTEKSTVWRRLLVMRAMGFVPWSGMNVACGVVGVDWRTFWLTTAAGSASWSYVTASVGHILARLAVPSASALDSGVLASEVPGESLTSLLRDPVLIFKLIFLSAISLLPVILKRRSGTTSTTSTSLLESDGTTPRSSSSFEMSDTDGGARRAAVQHPAISSLRLDLGTEPGFSMGEGTAPMSPLSQSLSRFTPTPRMFDLLSLGRSAVRQGQRALGAGVRAARGAA